ncbi:hypothetical protein CW304_28730 [Bacillus sp. UFRGS-B20]|nr:hypothetical protein CW304_28730 [Bacillus sp. UFRGS-B20]
MPIPENAKIQIVRSSQIAIRTKHLLNSMDFHDSSSLSGDIAFAIIPHVKKNLVCNLNKIQTTILSHQKIKQRYSRYFTSGFFFPLFLLLSHKISSSVKHRAFSRYIINLIQFYIHR